VATEQARRPARPTRPARKPRSRGSGPSRVRLVRGHEVVVRFDRMGPTGEAVATVGGIEVAVPYAAPGEEARVRIVDVERGRARGQLVGLRVASPRVVRPRCPHFGRCGGCQWQHLDYRAQLEQKTELVAAALRRGTATRPPPGRAISAAVAPTLGWDPPWEFRGALEAAVGWRDDRQVLGFFRWGGAGIVEISQCPVQHPANVAAMNAVRAAWEAFGSVTDAVRGLVTRAAAATGEVMLGLSVSRRLSLEERAAVVRALLDGVPNLVGVMEVPVPRRGHQVTGRRTDLLWGRPYVQEDVAGVRFRVPLLAEFPVNLRALPGLIEKILAALDASSSDAVLEPDAGIGGYTLHLALAAARVLGVTTPDQFDQAWENARLNGMANCAFYTRDPARALEKALRKGPVRAAFLHPAGTGLALHLPDALRRSGVRRVAYLGRALVALARDTELLERKGFRIREVQPIDLSPHTSRVHALITASAD
jgi:23S rRNA (uracil1939-C5)-methyltransferase